MYFFFHPGKIPKRPAEVVPPQTVSLQRGEAAAGGGHGADRHAGQQLVQESQAAAERPSRRQQQVSKRGSSTTPTATTSSPLTFTVSNSRKHRKLFFSASLNTTAPFSKKENSPQREREAGEKTVGIIFNVVQVTVKNKTVCFAMICKMTSEKKIEEQK